MEFQEVIEKLDTIEDAINVIPGLLRFESDLHSFDVNNLRHALDQIIGEKKPLLERRFLHDISEQESKILSKIGLFINLILSLKGTGQLQTSEEAQYLFDKIIANVNKLIIRTEHSIIVGAARIPTSEMSPFGHRAQPLAQEITFSTVCAEYIAERLSGKNWEPKTRDAYQVSFCIFKELMGDLPIKGVTDVPPSSVALGFRVRD